MSKIIKFKAPNPGHVARCGRTLGEIIHTYKAVVTEAAGVDEKTFGLFGITCRISVL